MEGSMMPNENSPTPPSVTEESSLPAEQAVVAAAPEPEATEPVESFGELMAEFDRTHPRKTEGGDARQKTGTVVALDAEAVYLDIGYKTEGVALRTAFANNAEGVEVGAQFPVTVKGRNPEGYYDLSLIRVAQPKDWTSLEEAFAQKSPVAGTVTAVVKGGLTVDIGVRAFMPASRSGTREAAEMEKLVGQEITCVITKLDTESEDVVVDRRVILEAQAKEAQQQRYAELREGDVVTGTVRNLMSYGAFVDLGGIDGMLHISDLSWSRVNAPEDVLSIGQELQLKVLKVEPETKRISLGLKQLEAEPWETAPAKYKEGERVTGTVTRLMDFGAFVELEPGVEGLVHVSEMSWIKKVRKPSDLLKTGDSVEVVVLGVNAAERRISLGLKQALGDPWADVPLRFGTGTVVEGPITRLAKFGAFLQLAEGIEGLIHISEIVTDRRLNHPQDALHVGEVVKAQILGVDTEKRQIKLSIKQLVPSSLQEYLEEHNSGDVVSGRVVSEAGDGFVVELGEGVRASCKGNAKAAETAAPASGGGLDLSSLTSMLNAKWKTGASSSSQGPQALGVGQVRSFKLIKVDREAQSIEVEVG